MARLFVPAGGALHVTCGDRSAPSHVLSTGMLALEANDLLVTAIDAIVAPGGADGCSPPDLHAARGPAEKQARSSGENGKARRVAVMVDPE
jgi:hypothetical protein